MARVREREAVTETAGEHWLFRALVDAAQIAVIATDREAYITAWNPAAELLFGYNQEDALGRSAIELAILPHDAQTAREVAARVGAGESWEGTFPVTSKSGSTLLVRFSASPMRGPDGTIRGLVVLARDVLRPEHVSQRAEMRLGLLSRAGALLGASLDVDETIADLAELLVPALADHCVIDLLDPAGDLVRRAAMHAPYLAEADIATSGWAAPGTVLHYPEDHPCEQVIRTHRTVHVGDAQRADLETTSMTAASAAFARKVGMRQVVALPLIARDEVRGVLSVAYSVSGRTYDHDDINVLDELAARAGIALDNALVHREQREVARTLQRTLLPGRLPTFDGLRLTSRYGTGSAAGVGGDWFDVVSLSAGRVGIVVGDVQGRGPAAAAVMAQLRAAIRAYALLDHQPHSVLTYLDELVTGLSGDVLVTCVYGAYDPWTRACEFACAGHPAPLLATDDECTPIPITAGVPLGVGGVPFEQEQLKIPPGARLVLYTDGVVECRGTTIESGIQALCKAVRSAGADPERACDLALAINPSAEDDRALLVLSTSEADLPVVDLPVPMHPAAVSTARQETADALKNWGLGDRADLAELLVSELVTNAMRHASATVGAAGEAVRLRLRKGERALWVEVYDADLRLPRLRRADSTDEGGRGLYLVDALAARWGTRPTRTGKAVWFRLDLD